ncbi:hypothetical protein FACS1894187_16500 [Synergistales bacterium]|nr:hypothetical protein FACS1894187_16500 [Synergistales bacterium]
MRNWKRAIVFALVLSVVSVSTADAAKYVEGEALVVLRNVTGQKLTMSSLSSSAGLSYVQSVANAAGAKAAATYHALSESAGEVLAHIKSDTKTTEELIAELKNNPNVISAQPNRISKIAKTPNDARYSEIWGMRAIGAERAWDTTTGSKGVNVAVIDTGTDGNHPDLKANLDAARGYNSVNDTSDFSDGQGHGTHVSGIIGAVGDNGIGVAGVNWAVNIIPIKAATDEGFFTSASTIGALNKVVDLQKNGDFRIYAVNMSYGGYDGVTPDDVKNYAEYKAYKALDDTGKTLMIMAAGNENHEVGVPAPADDPDNEIDQGDYCYPASFTGLDNMIVVGAIDKDYAKASFSNYSARHVQLAAPGLSILSTVPVAKGEYELSSGTSMAAPYVTGAVALLAANNDSLTASELKNLLLQNADATNKIINPTLSEYGSLNVGAAMVNVPDTTGVPLETISLSPDFVGLAVGESKSIELTIVPSNATGIKSKTWESEDESIAAVDESGRVTAVAPGVAKIVAWVKQVTESVETNMYVEATVSVAGSDPIPVPADTDVNTTIGNITMSDDAKIVYIPVTATTGAPITDSEYFYVWLTKSSAGDLSVKADYDYGPLVVYGEVLAGKLKLELNVNKLYDVKGNTVLIKGGYYNVRFADTKTGTTHVGIAKGVALLKSDGAPSDPIVPPVAGGGGGCDVGFGFAALLALSALVASRKK